MCEAITSKFKALVEGAINANHADEIKDDIFTGDVFIGWCTRHRDFDGFRHLEPGFTADHGSSDVGAAHAGRKCAHGTIGAGVTVGSDDKLTSTHYALFRQQAVLNPHLANFIIMFDLMLFGKIADRLALFSAFNILGR